MTQSLRFFVSALGVGLMMALAAHSADSSFDADVQFLRKHVDTIVLGAEPNGPRVAVVPAYQGRVMTSTTGGKRQPSFGWINYEQIASERTTPHINVYGGEERFWLGPEGGQFSIFFPPGAKFELADWQTPAVIDTDPFAVVRQDDSSVNFQHEAVLHNYAGTEFRVRIDRKISLLSADAAEQSLGRPLGTVQMVGYRSTNRLTNTGTATWTKTRGLLSIWLLGMYKPGPRTTVVIPFRAGQADDLGPIVNDAYFGKPPAERLVIGDGILFFSGDGQFRSKIGVPPRRARDIAGSWDADAGVLTVIKYSQPPAGVTEYVNSMWELQKEPFSGDVVNSYNDGPPAPGAKPLGPFYELETSSPALSLAPGAAAEHLQETYHFTGHRDSLDALARRLLGVSLSQIESGLPQRDR